MTGLNGLEDSALDCLLNLIALLLGMFNIHTLYTKSVFLSKVPVNTKFLYTGPV